MIRMNSLRRGRLVLGMTGPFEIALRALLIANLVLFLGVTGVTLCFPYDWDYGEGPLMDQARRIMAGEPLYKATLDEPPYVIANYPPLYPLLIAGIGAITHGPLLLIGRAISLLAALVSGFIVGRLAWRFSGDRLCGWLAAGIFLGNPLVMHWSRLARVDLLALALSLTGLWLLYRRWSSWPWLSVALLCLLASIYTRQTYALAAPLAGTVWLWRHDRRRALIFLATLAAATLSLFGALNAITRGSFYLHIVVANVNRYLIARTLSMGTILLSFCPIIIAIGGIALFKGVGGLRGRRPAAPPLALWGWVPYTTGAFLSALTVGKIGSHVNYLLELLAALAVWTAGGLGWLAGGRWRHRRFLLLLLLVQVIWMLGAGLWVGSATAERWRDLPRYEELYQQVRAATREGPVLADDYLGLVVMAGQAIYLQPFEYQRLHAAGLWDPSALIGEVEARRFPLILIHEPGSDLSLERWGPRLLGAIEANYEGVEVLPGLVAYRPKGGEG